MKLLVQSVGPHLYLDMHNGQEISAFRPSVVERTPYVQILQTSEKIELINAKLKDEATDEEFVKYLKDSGGDVDLAVSAFCKAFNPVEEVATLAPKKEAK